MAQRVTSAFSKFKRMIGRSVLSVTKSAQCGSSICQVAGSSA